MDISNMKEKHKLFAEHYALEQNATKSAIGAGYSRKGATTQGYRLLKNDDVKAYIGQLLGEVKEKFKLSHDYIIERLKAIAEQNKKTNPSVAVRALELLGKHLGMFEPKVRDLEERPAFVGININFGPKPSVDYLDKDGNKVPSPGTPAIDIKSKPINRMN